MALSAQQRRWLLGSALVLTLAAVVAVQQAEEADGDTAGHQPASAARNMATPENTSPSRPGISPTAALMPNATRPAAHAGAIATQSGGLPDIGEQRKQQVATDLAAAHADLLASHTWYVPPPPQAAMPVPVEKPVAPPAPFQYMGKLEDSPQGTLIFLSVRNKVQTVSAGQLIDTSWRLDKEDAAALYLTYMPLGSSQVLSKAAKRVVTSSPSDGGQPDTSQPVNQDN